MSEKPVRPYGDFQEPMLEDLLGQKFVIDSFHETEGGELGIRVVVNTRQGEYVTFSKVIRESLNRLLQKDAFPVEVGLKKEKGKVGDYYKFVDPGEL